MKTVTIVLVLAAALAACVATTTKPAKPDKTAECKRSPYCDTFNPAGKREDQREAELRSIREAVKAAQDDGAK